MLPSDADRANPSGLTATDWSADGRWLLAGAGGDLWLIPLVNDLKAEKFFASPAVEDARQLFAGRSSGGIHVERIGQIRSLRRDRSPIRSEMARLYKRRIRTALAGGWTRDLLPLRRSHPDGRPCERGVPHTKFGIPKPLFQAHVPPGVSWLRTHYVPSRDGQRFLVNVATDTVGFAHHCRAQLVSVAEQVTQNPCFRPRFGRSILPPPSTRLL